MLAAQRLTAGSAAALRPAAPFRRLRLAVDAKKGANRGKAVAKGDLPTKVCATCGLLFTWRKKWERVWDDVKYCSDRCRGNRPAVGSDGADEGSPSVGPAGR